MSGQVITDLFQQIVHSEEKIKQRFEDLKKVNQGIQDHQSKIKSLKYERDALLGKLNNMRHKMLEEQLEEKWMTIRENILLEQKQKCCHEENTLQNELDEIKESQKKDSSSFLLACDLFLKDYDILNGNSIVEQHQTKLKEKLAVLQAEEESLLKGLSQQKTVEEKRTKLNEDYERLKTQVEELMKNKDLVRSKLSAAQREATKMREMKESLVVKLQNNQSTKSLQIELDRCKKKLQYFTDEKSNLRRQVVEKSKRSTEYHHVETKPSNPWYISKQNTRPGFSQRQPSSVSALPTRRFQYKVSEGASTVKPESRKRPAADDMYFGEDLTSRSSQERCGGKAFDFDIELLDDDDDIMMTSYDFQKK